MKKRSYDTEVASSLAELTELAIERERTARLEGISKSLNRWKHGRTDSSDTLEEIRRTAGGAEASWYRNADPGVPVAHAVAVGLLKREEIPDRVWNSIEVLVTLAGI